MLPFRIIEWLCGFLKGHNTHKKQKVERDQTAGAIKLFAKFLFAGNQIAVKKHCSTAAAKRILPDCYGVFTPGSIDYTLHQKTMRILTMAMETKKYAR
ncbi:MAG: hypothetical protein J7K30_00645 [Deltaproteobacteria bacterium]|nr:hypothetical protein [Deltaproteobacteria bacterium]